MGDILSHYTFIKKSHINAYLAIIDQARKDAYDDFIKGMKRSYWQLEIPDKIRYYQKHLLEIKQYLSSDLTHLESIKD